MRRGLAWGDVVHSGVAGHFTVFPAGHALPSWATFSSIVMAAMSRSIRSVCERPGSVQGRPMAAERDVSSSDVTGVSILRILIMDVERSRHGCARRGEESQRKVSETFEAAESQPRTAIPAGQQVARRAGCGAQAEGAAAAGFGQRNFARPVAMLPRPSQGRPTLATVRRFAAVSTATVSNVLNGRPDNSATARVRVDKCCRVGYVPPRVGPHWNRVRWNWSSATTAGGRPVSCASHLAGLEPRRSPPGGADPRGRVAGRKG